MYTNISKTYVNGHPVPVYTNKNEPHVLRFGVYDGIELPFGLKCIVANWKDSDTIYVRLNLGKKEYKAGEFIELNYGGNLIKLSVRQIMRACVFRMSQLNHRRDLIGRFERIYSD